ncbi:uncharacterized protein LOC124128332 [Haliotis rufescens]|uniref:uncharacterized protein LOC124128332 n=1 Tax=Haliotis rufescens TaxID=6454 RepID=UPI00201EECE5|nr:uncharacterized protein LOC124128332 [Haliotis rufescens]XP_046347923.2 uncharacterized protein LOC124128332 [Haliotis rufescens]XP_046347987.2 uncharacterized protein LOC124128332 [Haliotis rufescens]XP_048256766.1 uncharacterized protein LOC124128332 [Haliotis rufescens]
MEFTTHRNTTDSAESLYDSAEDLTSDTSDAGENGHQSPNNTTVPDGNRNVPVGERSIEDVNRKIFELFAKPYLDRQTDSQDGVLAIIENIISFGVQMLGERVKSYAEKAYNLSKDVGVHGQDIENMLRFYEDSLMQGFRQMDVQVPHQLEYPSFNVGSHSTRHQHVIRDCYHVLRRDLMLDRTMLLDQLIEDDLMSATDASSMRKDRRRNERFLHFLNGRITTAAFEQKFLPALKKEHPVLEETLRRSFSSSKGINVLHKCSVCYMKDTVELRDIAEDMLSNDIISMAVTDDMRNDALSHDDKWKRLQGHVKDFSAFKHSLKKKYANVYQQLMTDEANSFQCLCQTRTVFDWTHPDSGDISDKASVFTADDAVRGGQGNSLYDRVANRIFPLLAQRFQEYFYTFKESPDFKKAVNKEMGSQSGNAVSSFPLQGPTYPQFAFSPAQPGTTFTTPRGTSTIGYRHPSTYGSLPGNSQQGPGTIGSLQYPMGFPVPPPPPFQSQLPAPPIFRYLAPPPPAQPPMLYMPLHGSHFRTTMASQTNEPSQHTEENAMPTFETIEEESNEELDVDLQTLSAKERYQYLGNRLYPKVKDITSANPGKITGMLLELDTEAIEKMMTSEDELRLKVDEAEQILQKHRDKDKTQ